MALWPRRWTQEESSSRYSRFQFKPQWHETSRQPPPHGSIGGACRRLRMYHELIIYQCPSAKKASWMHWGKISHSAAQKPDLKPRGTEQNFLGETRRPAHERNSHWLGPRFRKLIGSRCECYWFNAMQCWVDMDLWTCSLCYYMVRIRPKRPGPRPESRKNMISCSGISNASRLSQQARS